MPRFQFRRPRWTVGQTMLAIAIIALAIALVIDQWRFTVERNQVQVQLRRSEAQNELMGESWQFAFAYFERNTDQWRAERQELITDLDALKQRVAELESQLKSVGIEPVAPSADAPSPRAKRE